MLLAVATFAVLARTLSISQFGVLAFSITFSEIVAAVIDFGMSYHAIRTIAQGGNAVDLHRRGLWLRVLIPLPVFAGAACLLYLGYDASWRGALFVGVLGGLVKANQNYVLSFYTGRERLEFVGVVHFLSALMVAAATIGGLVAGVRSPGFLMGLRVGALVPLLIFSYYRMLVDFGAAVAPSPLRDVRQVFADVLPFGLFFLGGILYFQADSLILSLILEKEAVGVYQAAVRVIITFEALPIVVATAAYPTLARLYNDDRDVCADLLVLLTRLLTLVGTALAFGTYGMRSTVIHALYSQNLARSAPVLALLAFLLPVRFFAYAPGMAVTVGGQQRSRTIAVYLCVALSVLGNLYAIPRWGLGGAATMSLATSSLLALLYVSLQRVTALRRMLKDVVGPAALASIAPLLMLMRGSGTDLSELGRTALLVAVFLVGAAGAGLIRRGELRRGLRYLVAKKID